jgi:FkbM family methyltransferase
VTRHGAVPDAKAAARLLRTLAARRPPVGPRRVDKPLVLYGAGNLGHLAREYFDRLEIPIAAVVDSRPDAHRADPFWQGLEVLGPADVPAGLHRDALLAVCVATAPMEDLRASLEAQGWRDVVPFYDVSEAYRDRHPLGNGWFAGELGGDDVGAIEEVLARWDDDVSRAHHLQFIAWHALREDWLFGGAPVTAGDRYFIPEVRGSLTPAEVFVDAGAHHGEVCRRFFDLVDGRFREMWAIEADRLSIPVLSRELETLDPAPGGRARLLTCALGETSGPQPFFEGLGYASQLCAFGHDTIDVARLDDLAVEPTFLKLHLEGGELPALRGGVTTITRSRPIVTLTSYHSALGMWQVPKWLMDTLSGYRFLTRLHSWCGTGSVVYAIPAERRLEVRS